MATIPAQAQIDQAYLDEWFQAQTELSKLRAKEALMRKKIFETVFTEPNEGAANKHQLGEGFILQATHVINRKVDVAALESSKKGLENDGISVDGLITYKPELNKKAWNMLSDEDKHKFAVCLTERAGSPKLEIKQPKRAS